MNNSEFSVCLALDLKRAFDLMDRRILLRKIKCYGLSNNAVKWFESYLTARIQKVAVVEHMSEVETVLYGVPQGSIFGPLLFILFINDLPFNVEHCTLDMYADDTNAAAHGSSLIQTTENMQSDLYNIEEQ